ncbi:MAG: hypothetical protein Fues2KO_44180 [Fuerstiella sp.]
MKFDRLSFRWLLIAVPLLPGMGCTESDPSDGTAVTPPVRRASEDAEDRPLLPRELRRRLKANENASFERSGNDIVEARLFQSGIRSIEPLEGLPLRFLDLGMTEVSDLTPVRGMPLRTLILENTPVTDLSPLAGMQLEVLQLQNTKIDDLSVIEGMPIRELNLMAVPIKDLTAVAQLPLQTLWVPQTQVTDLSPLAGKPLASLDVEATEVADLTPLSGMTTLKRLNIAQTAVTDLTPLKGLTLERITLTPDRIENGIEVLRSMPSLSQILTTMQGPGQSAAQFWAKYDEGVWDEDPAPTESDSQQSIEPEGDSAEGSKAGAETPELAPPKTETKDADAADPQSATQPDEASADPEPSKETDKTEAEPDPS